MFSQKQCSKFNILPPNDASMHTSFSKYILKSNRYLKQVCQWQTYKYSPITSDQACPIMTGVTSLWWHMQVLKNVLPCILLCSCQFRCCFLHVAASMVLLLMENCQMPESARSSFSQLHLALASPSSRFCCQIRSAGSLLLKVLFLRTVHIASTRS